MCSLLFLLLIYDEIVSYIVDIEESDLGFARRIESIIEDAGGPVEFARKTGFSRAVVDKYKNGISDPSRSRLVAMARVANVSLEWLATGYGPRTPRGIPALQERDRKAMADGTFWDKSPEEQEALDEANMQGFVSLPVMNIMASAGGGAAALTEHQTGVIKFDRAWLYNTWHLNPNDLFTMPTMGESMEPTIKAGEYLLASRAEDHLKPGDGIYIVRLDGHILVKRLQPLPGGKLMVSSDNPAYKPFEVELDDGIDFAILGKVVLVHGVRRV